MSEFDDFAAQLRRAAAVPPADAVGGGLGAVFDEEPVSLTVFVQDRAYLANPRLSEIQYEAVRHIERIYYPQTYVQMAEEFEAGKQLGRFHAGAITSWRDEPYWSTPVRMTNFVTLQWAKGSGKDHICRIASMRIAYLLMCLQSPQTYFGMPEQDSIHLLNVASTAAQAQQAFFMPILRSVRRGWFAGKCQPRQNVISYAKNIESISGHSDAESQEGLNLLLGIADEIDAFKSKKEMAFRRGASAREPTKSVEGILNMIRTSGSTRFPEVFKRVAISYPRYLGSMIQQLTEQGKADIATRGIDSRHYVSGPYATWEVNPRVPGKSAFADDYVENAEMARAKYECRPSRAVNPYFRNHQAVDACFQPVAREPISIDYKLDTVNGRRAWVPVYNFADDFFPVRGAIYAMHADLAVLGDRAGIAMAHVVAYSEHETIGEDEDGAPHTLREVRPHVKVDFATAFTSNLSTDPPREIQIRWGRQLCFELIRRGFTIRRFTFDAFASTDSMQILESKGIESERVSTDVSEDPWRNLRDQMYEGRLTITRPVGPDADDPLPFLLRDELLSLTRQSNGKVNHPAEGSKDIADAVACSVLGAVICGGQEETGAPRAYFSGPDITTGTSFALPIGMDPRKTWETTLPALY